MIHLYIPYQICAPQYEDGFRLEVREAMQAEHDAVDRMYRSGEFLCMGCFHVKPTIDWMFAESFISPIGHKRFIFGAFIVCAKCSESRTALSKAKRAARTRARDMAERGEWGQIC